MSSEYQCGRCHSTDTIRWWHCCPRHDRTIGLVCENCYLIMHPESNEINSELEMIPQPISVEEATKSIMDIDTIELAFKTGDTIRDKDGDRGTIIIAIPDAMGYLMWVCTDKNTKEAQVGVYYQSRPEDLTKVYPYRDAVTATGIVNMINGFEQRCVDNDRTDTDDVWKLLNDIRAILT